MEIFGDCQERIQLLLGNVHLTVVHEVEDCGEIAELHAFQVQEGVGVGVASEHASEEGRAGREDDFVGLDLLIIAGQGHVEEVLVIPKLAEGC